VTGGLGGQSTRGGAHVEYAVHLRDAGGVEAQRLIEGRRALPRSRAGRMMLGEVCGPEGGGAKGRGAAARAQGACTRTTRDWEAVGAGHVR